MKSNMWIGAAVLVLVWNMGMPAAAQNTLVPAGADWRYLDDGSNPGAEWSLPEFDDSIWAHGPAQLGYGHGDEATVINYGPDVNNKYMTYYFRHTFDVPNAASFTNVRVLLLRDDGAIVYVNGLEAFRSNMPEGPVTYLTPAASGASDNGTVYYPFHISPSLLVNGANVIAVEVHQNTNTSTDISFDLDLTGNPLPLVSISSPSEDQVIVGENITISGTAIAGGSNVTLVEAFTGSTKVGESTNAAFTMLWTNAVPGNYTLRAVVTDSAGLIATSAPVDITVRASPSSELVPAGSVWKYLDNGSDQGTAWQALEFDDSSWKSGPAQLGYGDGDEATVISYGPNSSSKYTTTYFRRLLEVSNPSGYYSLTLTLTYDDGAVVYMNGAEVARVHMPEGTILYNTFSASPASDYSPITITLSPSVLVPGTNIIAVEMHQSDLTSSDVSFDLKLTGDQDDDPPSAGYDPTPDSTLVNLSMINVTFSETVIGIEASDLLINGQSATSIITNNPNDFTFYFTQPPMGIVEVAWAPNHGITDLSPLANAFSGGSWRYLLDTNALKPNVMISEFLAANSTGIIDEDGNHSDWIELYNASTVPAVLDGYYLTDTPTNLTKWQFPSGMAPLQANKYFVVWASGKDRRDPLALLHTNFKLARDAGSYLALVDPTGTNIVSVFDSYPQQQTDMSYGRDVLEATRVGYYSTPTPGKVNSTRGSGVVPEPVISMESGIYTNASISVTISVPNALPGTVIHYTQNDTNNIVPSTKSKLYSGPITISVNTMLKARAFPPAGTNLWPSEVIARNYIFLDNTDIDFNSNLPLLIISTHGQAIPDNVPPGGTRAEGTLAVIETDRGRSSLRGTPQFIGMAGFELYGQTSIGFPKPPVRFEIHDSVGNDLEVSLLGLPADADWKTRNPYDDKTLLNDYLGYELFEKMGHYSCRRRFVEMFVDTGGGRLTYPGDYVGVEVLFETIEIAKNRVDLTKLTPYDNAEPNITGGYIFKKDKDSNGDINFSTAGNSSLGFTAQALKIHDPKPEELRLTPVTTSMTSFPGPGYTPSATNQLTYLINYLNAMESALYSSNWTSESLIGTTNHYSYYMDVDAFVDQHWIVEFTKQIDGYRLSDYFSKDRGGKIAPYPIWDWNLSFGNAYYLRGGHTNGWYFQEQDEGITSSEHIWLRRLINGNAAMGGLLPDNSGNALSSAGGDREFNQKIADRWSVLRTNVLNGTNVLQEIDELSAMLNEACARDLWGKWRSSIVGSELWPNPDGAFNGTSKANHRWDVDYVHPTNYLGPNSIIEQMKKWVLGRYLWIDGQFTPQILFDQPGGLFTNSITVTMSQSANTTNWYTLDGTDPRAYGGEVSANAQTYTGPIPITSSALVFARARGTNGFYNVWGPPSMLTLYTELPALRITEINYHPYDPPTGSTNDANDFEFIEVKNTGSTPLNLNRFRLSGGIRFNFPNMVLESGQSAVVVKNVAAFQSRYGTSIVIVGTFTGNLANEGDHIALEGGLGEPIHDFKYSDSWYPTTDGTGFTLVIADENADPSTWGSRSAWRVSTGMGGSPGATDPPPPARPEVVINEVVSHTDTNVIPGLLDTIEIYNPTASIADISGWFLTDNWNMPRKFVIPTNTRIPPGCYITFTEADFNDTNSHNVVRAFALSSLGEEVYIFSASGTNLTGYARGFDFGAQATGVSFGRYVISTGEDQFVAQSARSLGTNNAGPLVGPVVISEIMYEPPEAVVWCIGLNNFEDEYIELQNISSEPAPLYDPNHTTNTWHLRNAVDFDFPRNVVLGAGEYLLVVPFDPAADPAYTAAWRARNYVPETLPLYGPWHGSLDNAGESVELRRPDNPDWVTNATSTNLVIPSILVERIKYSNESPWPRAADGLSLQRIVPAAYGNDPTNWVAVASSPGEPFIPGAVAPVIVSQPTDQLLILTSNYFFSVAATGAAPLRYEWRFNGVRLPGATSSNLTLTSLAITNAGIYNILVYNAGGSALGTNFTITARVGLAFTKQPRNIYVTNNVRTNFYVVAIGSGVLTYQWKFNGIDIPGATGPTNFVTAMTNAQGSYSVVIRDDYDVVESTPATLTLIYAPSKPMLTPFAQTVAEGSELGFTATVSSGTEPIGFQWRKQNERAFALTIWPGVLPNASTSYTPTSSVLTIAGVQLSNASIYSVVASNIVTIQGGTRISSNAPLVVVRPPVDQAVTPGRDVTLRAVVSLPIKFTNRFDWLFNGTELLSGTNTSTTNLLVFTNELVLSNVSEAQSGIYTFLACRPVLTTNLSTGVVTTNFVGAPAEFSALMSVLQDADGDGMPDAWESAYTLNPNDASDADLDGDGDGMSNLQEYLAGTDPTDASNMLKIVGVEHRLEGTGNVKFEFLAVSNRTYRVEYIETLQPGAWNTLSNIEAVGTNRMVTVTDGLAPYGAQRFYRVRTP